jgi:dipeptidyl-peptidase-4
MRNYALVAMFCAAGTCHAQDRFRTLPGYEAYAQAQQKIRSVAGPGRNPGRWHQSGQFFILGSGMAFDTRSNKLTSDALPPEPSRNSTQQRSRPFPSRGRQFTIEFSPDNKLAARCVNDNVQITSADSATDGVVNVTTDAISRVQKYGTASWVYGEELNQNSAMWWSPDSKKLAFYKFNDKDVPEYYLTLGQGGVQNRLYSEAYPKAGAPNPIAEILVYDLASGKTTRIETDFKSVDPDIAHYIYSVSWSKNNELLFHRTNRKQNYLEFVIANADTGKCRVAYSESNPSGWVDNVPRKTWLADGRTFLVISERTGFYNIYLAHLDTGKLTPITAHNFEVEAITNVNEATKTIWYTARSGNNPYLLQLHKVKFDGKGEKRLTDPSFSHSTRVSAETGYFYDAFTNINSSEASQICNSEGKPMHTISANAADPYKALGLRIPERFVCKAADGKTDIYGIIKKPSNFDPAKKYPVILEVYGGPESGTNTERLLPPEPLCELGYVYAWIDGRGTQNRGREFRQSVYKKLGVVEIDDQAAAMKALSTLPYIDGTRIGIEGTSYGGYASTMALVRYPDIFAAACAQSSVTSWYHYDSIYTERYMDTPQNNPDGYTQGSAMEYARQMKGALCLFYGTADDNVHPSNTHNLIRALDAAGKNYRVYIGVDQGHTGLQQARMMEFFYDTLKPMP